MSADSVSVGLIWYKSLQKSLHIVCHLGINIATLTDIGQQSKQSKSWDVEKKAAAFIIYYTIKSIVGSLCKFYEMMLETDLTDRVLKVCASKQNYGLNVPSLRQLSLQSTAIWAVCTLHRLHDSPRKVRASSDDIIKAARDVITNKIPRYLNSQIVVNHSLLILITFSETWSMTLSSTYYTRSM